MLASAVVVRVVRGRERGERDDGDAGDEKRAAHQMSLVSVQQPFNGGCRAPRLRSRRLLQRRMSRSLPLAVKLIFSREQSSTGSLSVCLPTDTARQD